jgi:hypothetical protein
MAFLRADTARTMLSRTNSTSELSLGVCQVLYDANGQLPDNLEDLEVGFKTSIHTRVTNIYVDVVRNSNPVFGILPIPQAMEKELADLEAKQSQAGSSQLVLDIVNLY